MNTYRIFKVAAFPTLKHEEFLRSQVNLTLPGFTEEAITTITCISNNYYGYEYFEFAHEMLIKDTGLAYGFLDNQPVKLEFSGYKKLYTVKAYLNRPENFILISQSSFVVKDLFKKIKLNQHLKTNIDSYNLDLNKVQELVSDYNAVWFKGVSTRVSSSALFGSDLANDPLFEQFQNDGANLSSIIIPFEGIPIQIGDTGGISTHVTITNIPQELKLIEKVKADIIDKVEIK